MEKTSSSAVVQHHGIGRRKSSVARIWLKHGKGSIVVNGKPYNDYFDTEVTRKYVEQPLVVIGNQKGFDINVNVQGGGLVSQAGAIRLGIARALVESDATLKAIFKKHKFLTSDSRVKERKKYGQKAARAKFQFVKR